MTNKRILLEVLGATIAGAIGAQMSVIVLTWPWHWRVITFATVIYFIGRVGRRIISHIKAEPPQEAPEVKSGNV